MGPYLHFGQISPLYLALKMNRAPDSLKAVKDAYIEQLVIRRELAMNFAFYTSRYDAYTCIPGWARKTLAEHAHDKRDYVYSRRQLESAGTLERQHAGDEAYRLYAQLHAHVLGQENPGMVGDAAKSIPHDPGYQQ
jgi:hypothetical protein